MQIAPPGPLAGAEGLQFGNLFFVAQAIILYDCGLVIRQVFLGAE
jgi:hypothetical protein